MKKNEIKEKLADAGCFLVCVAVILGIAYFTGFLKGFAPQDFVDAYNNLTANLSNSSLAKNAGKNIDSSSGNSGRNETYEGYPVAKIPDAVLRGVRTTRMWAFLLENTKKTVFYIYDDSSEEFNSAVKNYLSTKKNASIYELYAYSKSSFSSMNIGNYGSDKICNSLEECNAVRQRASDYSSMTSFLNYCGRTMCVFDPSTQKYIRLKNRNNKQAAQMLDDLRYW